MQAVRRIKRNRTDLLRMVIGTLLMALSTNLFFAPSGMIPGGFTGLAMILRKVTEPFVAGGIPIWLGTLILNVPLLIFAVLIRGWAFIRRTAAATLLLSAWLWVVPEIDLVSDDLVIVAVVGGALMGLGVGVVFLGKATTGGTDTAAAILQRFLPHLSAAKILPVLDGAIILLSVWSFGLRISCYAIISVVLSGMVSDAVVNGFKNACLAYIISEKHDEISREILSSMERGVTLLPGRGLYTNTERPVLMCAVSRKQLPVLRDLVADTDPSAFLVLAPAREVRGEGFMAYSREEF